MPVEFDEVRPYAIEMVTRFRGIARREGVLVRGSRGWAEFCPFEEYSDAESVPWLAAAVEQCGAGWPSPVRSGVDVNCIVPAVDAERAREIVESSGCSTAKVKVAGGDHADDVERVETVADALGPGGAVRVDANGAWSVDTAVNRIRDLDRAAGGLEYVEQPCGEIAELARVRKRVDVRIAADESIRRAEDPLRVAVAEAADVAVLKCAPLGGVRRALQVADGCGLPCVVSSALETSVGLAAEVALAAALPTLDFACGLGTLALLRGDVVRDSLRPVQGSLRVPVHPPEPDPELLDRHAMADPARREWWLRRLERVAALLG